MDPDAANSKGENAGDHPVRAEEEPAAVKHATTALAAQQPSSPATEDKKGRDQPLLQVDKLRVEFAAGESLFRRKDHFAAVRDVCFQINAGETLALVGESGSGKSSVARAVLNLIKPRSGTVKLDGHRIDGLTLGRMRPHRRKMQMVFQDPHSSLNPRMTVAAILTEPMTIFGIGGGASERRSEAGKLLELVSLPPDSLDRWPHEFSGGQKQRIAIARSLAVRPKLLICDEPTSSLDVSVQAQIINLFLSLREQFDLAYLFITHDLALARHISHRTAIMRTGEIVEQGLTSEIFAKPKHEYTRELLASVLC